MAHRLLCNCVLTPASVRHIRQISKYPAGHQGWGRTQVGRCDLTLHPFPGPHSHLLISSLRLEPVFACICVHERTLVPECPSVPRCALVHMGAPVMGWRVQTHVRTDMSSLSFYFFTVRKSCKASPLRRSYFSQFRKLNS